MLWTRVRVLWRVNRIVLLNVLIVLTRFGYVLSVVLGLGRLLLNMLLRTMVARQGRGVRRVRVVFLSRVP